LYQEHSEPLLDEVEALQAWLALRPDDGSGFLFTSQKGGGLHRTQFFRMFQAAAKKARLPTRKQHPRILKYSLAAHLLIRKADLSLIGRLLGHRSANSTQKIVKAAAQQNTLLATHVLSLLRSNLAVAGQITPSKILIGLIETLRFAPWSSAAILHALAAATLRAAPNPP